MLDCIEKDLGSSLLELGIFIQRAQLVKCKKAMIRMRVGASFLFN